MLKKSRKSGDKQFLVSDEKISKKNKKYLQEIETTDMQADKAALEKTDSVISDIIPLNIKLIKNNDRKILDTDTVFSGSTTHLSRENMNKNTSAEENTTANDRIQNKTMTMSNENLSNEQVVTENYLEFGFNKIDSYNRILTEEPCKEFPEDDPSTNENLLNEHLAQIYSYSNIRQNDAEIQVKKSSKSRHKNAELINKDEMKVHPVDVQKETSASTRLVDETPKSDKFIFEKNNRIDYKLNSLEFRKGKPKIDSTDSETNKSSALIVFEDTTVDSKKIADKVSNEAKIISPNLGNILVENIALEETQSNNRFHNSNKNEVKKSGKKRSEDYLQKSNWTKFDDDNRNNHSAVKTSTKSDENRHRDNSSSHPSHPSSTNQTKNTLKTASHPLPVSSVDQKYVRSIGDDGSAVGGIIKNRIDYLDGDCFVDNSRKLRSICVEDEIRLIDEDVIKHEQTNKNSKAKKRIKKTGKTLWTGLRMGWKLLVDGLVALSGPLSYVDFSHGVNKAWSQKRNNF